MTKVSMVVFLFRSRRPADDPFEMLGFCYLKRLGVVVQTER